MNGELLKKARGNHVIVLLAAVSFIIGLTVRGCFQPTGVESGDKAEHEEHGHGMADTGGVSYVCPMMCVPAADKPGKCPVCGMKLEPVSDTLTLSPKEQGLAGVEVVPVSRKDVQAEIRMVGKIAYDETRLSHVAARVDGRLDRLYADFSGMRVEKGDHLVSLYSPDLLSAQEELIQALRANDSENAAAVREKLRLWGLTRAQIQDVEKRKKASEHVTIHSPISGIVVEKNVLEGEYVKTGTEIYTIADLSRLWVKLDAYESDLSFVKYGQGVELATEAYPGETFAGTVAFIDPVLDEKTRTAKVRVNVENAESKLKPGMFVHATVRPTVVEGGNIVGVNMAGKKVCPMHPEIVSDAEGSCSICGMALVDAEKTQYFDKAAGDHVSPLVIPVSAPLLTGKRAVVYVQAPGKPGTYEGRHVVLGPRAGGYYVVREGLAEGDLVVARGSFQLDSAQQIRGQVSMMTSPADNADTATDPTEERVEKRPQTHCPIMGGEINREVFVDHGGYRIYFCCAGCEGPFKKDADKLMKKMQDEGIVLEKSPGE